MANRPAPEIAITVGLIRQLLREQHEDLAGLPLALVSRGWDNTNFRLGEHLLVRLPHREVAAQLIRHEQRRLPSVATNIDLPIPAAVRVGRACSTFPWPWSITPWFSGVEASSTSLTYPGQTARKLADFFAQLHVPAPVDAPVNPYRGCPLADRATAFRSNVSQLGDRFDRSRIGALFDRAVAIEPSTERVWLHGDLHARNMIVDDGELAAVIDWGDICAGDRATDLAAAYMLVPDHLEIVRAHAGARDTDWERAIGWAINFAVVYLANSDDDPVMGRIGTRLLEVLSVPKGA